MQVIKETCPWPHPRVRPRIRNILPRYESYQSSCRTALSSLRRAVLRCETFASSLFLFFCFFLFFFSRSPSGVLALSLPSAFHLLLRLSFSRAPSYYVLRRYEPLLLSGSDRPTDVCKSRVMQYAAERESKVDDNNRSAIDRYASRLSCRLAEIALGNITHRCVLMTPWK